MKTALQRKNEIRKTILNKLYWDRRIDTDLIRVEIHGGTVTLSGTVASPDDRKIAETEALTVPGVKSVRNDLVVSPDVEIEPPSDENIEQQIFENYLLCTELDLGPVHVSVQDGEVILEGDVASHYHRIRAEELVEDIPGVLNIENRIVIVPTESTRDREIAEEIVSSFSETLGYDADRLSVMVKNRAVILTGSVDNDLAQLAVENIARGTPGVLSVRNLVTVKGTASQKEVR